MPNQRFFKLNLFICAAIFLSSCVSQLEPLPRDSSIQVSITPGADRSDGLNYDGTLSENVTTGAGLGLTVGSLAAGAACGPWFALCAIGGGLVGIVTGAAAGGLYGIATAIDGEKREQLDHAFGSVFATKTQDQYIEEYFNRHAKVRWTIDSVSADYTIFVRFDQFSVIQQSADRFVLGFVASLTITDRDLQPDNKSNWYRYQHLTPERELDFFLDKESGNFEYEFERGLDAITSQMVNSF